MSDYAPRHSEFVELAVTALAPTPLDLGGACSASFTVIGDNVLFARDRSMPAGERFLIPDMTPGGTTGASVFTIQSSDERIWMLAEVGVATVYIWITREVGA